MNSLQIVIPIFAGLGGYFLRYFLDLKKEAEVRRLKDKRKHYKNLILCLKSIREGNADNLELLWFEYSFLWLHAPDMVINSFNKLLRTIQLGSRPSEDMSLLIGDLLVSIRRDMGFPKTSLKSEDFKGKLDKF